MRDVRLLTLYKQHYMDQYKYELQSQFSCWGHFDGFDIQSVDMSNEGAYAENDSNASLSQLWSAIERKQEKYYGGFSSQNIGVFRSVSTTRPEAQELGKLFWQEAENMPFCAVGFIQLSKPLNYEKISIDIECVEQFSRMKEQKCNILVYTTFDNADLVVVLYSNSIRCMEQKLQELEEIPEIEYLYSVIGVSSQYLDALKNYKALYMWKGTRCFLEDKLLQISLQLSTNGKEPVKKMESVLEKICDDATITRMHDFGHTNATITISNTDVRTLLLLTLPNGTVTHQNYGGEIYNIETSFSAEIKDKVEEYKESSKKMLENARQDVWCENLIDKYKIKLERAKRRQDESFCSHYRAIIQTLNTLAQYEQFALAKDIFYLLFPAFCMFDGLLEDAEQRQQIQHYEDESIKETLRYFIDSVHSVMRHIVSNQQTFFMIPGYSGISFSVPIKLILMYLWFINKVAKILNDCDYQYECILTPEAESRPMTKLLDFGRNNNNRLICVHIGQRLLFYPKNLMIVLAHEIGHYIGKDLRNRKERAQCILHTLSYILAEMVIPQRMSENALDNEEKYILNKLCTPLRKTIRRRALDFMYEGVISDEIGPDYYSNKLEKSLINHSKTFLNDLFKEWKQDMPSAFEQIINEVEIAEERYRERLQFIYDNYYTMQNNIQSCLASNVIDKIVRDIIKLYREVFSDIVALVVLNCNEKDFEETFSVSEGININQYTESDQQILREKIVHFLKQIDVNEETMQSDNLTEQTSYSPQDLAETLYTHVGMQTWLKRYAIKCYRDLKERLCNLEVWKDVEEVRKYFTLFGDNKQVSCHEIYNKIVHSTNDYLGEIDRKYQKIIDEHIVF